LLQPFRWLSRRCPGAKPGIEEEDKPEAFGWGILSSECTSHDPSLSWPTKEQLALLPPDWLTTAKATKSKQPFFLNRVRGNIRCRQAGLRSGTALATLLQVGLMALCLDGVAWDSYIGATAPTFVTDVSLGALTGLTCVLLMFFGGVGMGWLQVVGYGQVLLPGESLTLNLVWDVIFHLAVSINEEVSLRGWLLPNLAIAFVVHLGSTPALACFVAVAVESCYFSCMHWGSPGITRQGMINLTIGGIAAALNVVLSGGLGFALGFSTSPPHCSAHC